jgi:hypothetical protein
MNISRIVVIAGIGIFGLHYVSQASAQTNDWPATEVKIVSVPNSSMQLDGEVKTINGMTPVRIYHEQIEMQNVDDHSRSTFDLVAIHDPKTHSVFRHIQRGKINNLTEWCNGLGLLSVPDVGLIRIGGTLRGIIMEIYTPQATDFDEWKKGMLEELAKRLGQGQILPAYEEHRAILDESLGRDFFVYPSCPSHPAPPVKVSLVEHSTTGWEFELQSGVTTDKAVIFLDSSFKVLRAFRNNKQVYPVTSDVPKDK